MNGLRRFAFVCMIVSLVVGLSACDELVSILSSSDMPQMDGVQGEIPIGVVLPLTGKDAGPYGLSMKNGFDLALAEINSAQLGGGKYHLHRNGQYEHHRWHDCCLQ